jgi:hypothetical protein
MMAGVTETSSRPSATAVSKRSSANGGLLAPGWHKLRILGAEEGPEGQSEPDEPANVLTPNGGDHAVSWTGRSHQGNSS